jgi:hypothetical protein
MPKLSNKNIYKHRNDDPVFKIGHRLDYYRHLRDLIEGHKATTADLGFRNKLIREQQSKNYQMEYDRIRNSIEKSVAPGVTKQKLEDRLKELKKLGARAINTIQ